MAGLEGMQLGSCHILRRIGGGGMGEVYLAEQPDLNRQVAVKVIHGESGIGVTIGEQSKAVEQFTREARAVAALSHPHILPIYDFGEQNGLHYLVMEYVPSGSLANIDISSLNISPEVIASLMLQAGSALQYAHDHHIIHLDVKPQNLLVKLLSPMTDVSQTPGGARQDALETAQGPMRLSVLLADFGLARLTTWSAQSSIAGTPLYAAPEQYTGSPSPASDQYALAGVAFLLLTRQNVFTGTLAELYHQHMSVPAPLANTINPALSLAVSTVLARALAKNPTQRFPTVWEFTQALAAAIRKGVVPDMATAVVTSGPSLSGNSGALGAFAPPSLPATSATSAGSLMTPPIAPTGPAISGTLGASSTSGGLGSQSETAAMRAMLPNGIPMRAAEPLTYREPDGQLAPLPPERFTLSPTWRAVAIGVLVALVVGVGAGIIITHIRSQTPPPTLLTPVATHIQSSGVQAVITSQATILREIPTLRRGETANELHMSLAIPTSLDTGGVFSSTNSSLPLLPSSQAITVGIGLPSIHSTTVAIPENMQRPGVGQAQTGAEAIETISLASDGVNMIEVVNGVLLARTSAQTAVISLTRFLQPLVSSGESMGEAHIVYDQATANWILVTNAVELHAANVHAGAFDVAISASDDVFGEWYLFKFSSQQPSIPTCNWAENPQIGLAGATLFISAVSYGCGALGASRQRLGAAVWALPLAIFASGGNAQITLLSGFTNTRGGPALNLTPSVAGPNDTTEWLMSNDSDPTNPQAASNRIALWAIRGVANGAGPFSVLSGVFTLPMSYADPGPAQQANQPANTTGLLNTGDAQIAQLLWVNQHLYASLATGVNWNGEDTTRSAVVWFEITPTLYGPGAASGASSPGISLRLNQISMLGAPGLFVFYPALVVDAHGNVGLFAQFSSAHSNLGILYAPHYARAPAATLGHPDDTVAISVSAAPFTGAHWNTNTAAIMTKLSISSGTGLAWIAIPTIAPVIITPKQGNTPAVTANQWDTAIWQVQL